MSVVNFFTQRPQVRIPVVETKSTVGVEWRDQFQAENIFFAPPSPNHSARKQKIEKSRKQKTEKSRIRPFPQKGLQRFWRSGESSRNNFWVIYSLNKWEQNEVSLGLIRPRDGKIFTRQISRFCQILEDSARKKQKHGCLWHYHTW